MKKLITTIAITLIICGFSIADTFNEYNVWNAVESDTLDGGESVSFGTFEMTDRDEPFSVLVYATTDAESLEFTINIYGMMTYELADTLHRITLYASGAQKQAGVTYVFSDTLDDAESFPFIYGDITNDHADTAATFDVFLYSRPSDSGYYIAR
jgi:hypothetical protein